MNRALAQCIVASLRLTSSCEDDLEHLKTFGRRDWDRTLPWLDDSGLALYLLRRTEQSGSPSVLPAQIRARLQRNLASNQRRLTEMKEEFAALNRRFEATGVEYAVLKGFALVPDYCPDAALRNQYDYDYLVPPESLESAQRTLRSSGYSQKVKSPGFEKQGESIFSAQALSLPSPDEGFYSMAISRPVELHLGLWESNREMVDLEVPTGVLERRRLTNWEGLSFPVLADDDTLIFEAIHAFQHILNFWCKPSCFLEIAHFIARRRSDAALWEQLRRRVDAHKTLAQVMGLVFSMAALLFKAPIPPEVGAWTTEGLSAPLSLWVERHGRNWALARHPGNKLSLLVHREFVEDPETWRKVMWSRLFPVHRPAQVVESGSPTLASHWLATRDEAYYVLSRLKFHLNAMLSYAWELPRWKSNLRRLQQGRR